MEENAGHFELIEGMEETVIIPLLKNKLLSESFSNAIIKDDRASTRVRRAPRDAAARDARAVPR